jgi:xanthine dehydrogenase small subunit
MCIYSIILTLALNQNCLIHFILNREEIRTTAPPGLTLLDFIRYTRNLPGTKIGCREGDCGACTILVGELKDDELIYTSATSCLMPLGNAAGKHIVTIEGINIDGLTGVQQAFADEGATQCGFCTPGFIVSLTGYCMNPGNGSYDAAIDSMNGNICRCTGYKSIERAASRVCGQLSGRNNQDSLRFAVTNKFIPEYFLGVQERLKKISMPTNGSVSQSAKMLGGGTDLYVQQHETIVHEKLEYLFDKASLQGIKVRGNTCEMGGAVTVSDIAESAIFKKYFPDLDKYIKLVSSTQIRNMATVAGNFVNASPIGDLTIFFLALNARLTLNDELTSREIALRELYKGYKDLDKRPGEIVSKISFELPSENELFNFEKVSKRTNLDIASVNSAIWLRMDGETVSESGISAGGVGPVPMYLAKTSAMLMGKKISSKLVLDLVASAQTEISPISDARGSENYKRLLLSQLIKAHFITLFPELPVRKLIEA